MARPVGHRPRPLLEKARTCPGGYERALDERVADGMGGRPASDEIGQDCL